MHGYEGHFGSFIGVKKAVMAGELMRYLPSGLDYDFHAGGSGFF